MCISSPAGSKDRTKHLIDNLNLQQKSKHFRTHNLQMKAHQQILSQQKKARRTLNLQILNQSGQVLDRTFAGSKKGIIVAMHRSLAKKSKNLTKVSKTKRNGCRCFR